MVPDSSIGTSTHTSNPETSETNFKPDSELTDSPPSFQAATYSSNEQSVKVRGFSSFAENETAPPPYKPNLFTQSEYENRNSSTSNL